MPIERFSMTFAEVVQNFPYLEEWFSNPENRTAQVQDDKRLLSASEKLALVGGEAQIRANLAVCPRGWREQYTILLACRQEPMVGMEIAEFGMLVGQQFHVNIYSPIVRLRDSGELSRVEGLTYIRKSFASDRFTGRENIPGYKTTDQGMRVIAEKLAARPSGSWLGSFSPNPNR